VERDHNQLALLGIIWTQEERVHRVQNRVREGSFRWCAVEAAAAITQWLQDFSGSLPPTTVELLTRKLIYLLLKLLRSLMDLLSPWATFRVRAVIKLCYVYYFIVAQSDKTVEFMHINMHTLASAYAGRGREFAGDGTHHFVLDTEPTKLWWRLKTHFLVLEHVPQRPQRKVATDLLPVDAQSRIQLELELYRPLFCKSFKHFRGTPVL